VSPYRVVVTKEGDDWLADVQDLAGAHTFARNLESLDRFVREVIVLAADLPDDAMPGLDLEWEYSTGDEALDGLLAHLRAERRQMDALRALVERETEEFARRVSARFSVRDSAALLGVSRARAQQLLASGRTEATAAH
jgi:hypothetical protein